MQIGQYRDSQVDSNLSQNIFMKDLNKINVNDSKDSLDKSYHLIL